MIRVRLRTDTKEPRWQCDFKVAPGGTGKPRRYRLNAPPGVTSRSGALRWGKEQYNRVARGEEPEQTRAGRAQLAEQEAAEEPVEEQRPEGLTVAQWVTVWEADERAKRLRESTLENRRKATKHLIAVCGWKLVAAVTDLDLAAVRRDMMSLSPHTASQRLGNILACLEAARSMGLRSEPLTRPHVRGANQHAERPHLTAEEAARLVVASKELSARHRGVVLAGLDLGLRAGEIAGLRIEDIDGRLLHIRRSIAIVGGVRLVHPTKSGKPRSLPMTSRLEAVLRELVASAEEGWLMGRDATRRTIDVALAMALRRAGLPRRGPHILRHTCASLAIESGVNLKVVQRLLGHTHLSTTARYLHTTESALADAISRIEIAQESAAERVTVPAQKRRAKKRAD